jgi:hypothetical protein
VQVRISGNPGRATAPGDPAPRDTLESDPRRVDPVDPLVLKNAAGRLDLGSREVLKTREPRLLNKLIPDHVDLAAGPTGSRLFRGDLLVVVDSWDCAKRPPNYRPSGSLTYTGARTPHLSVKSRFTGYPGAIRV